MAKAKKNKKRKSKRDLPPAHRWLADLKGSDHVIYLLHGEEAMFSHQATQWLVQEYLGSGIPDFNLDRFDASESQFSISALLNALNTQPMMSNRRVVWVQAAEVLNKQPKSKLEGLIKYCAHPNPYTCFILEARDRLDQTRALMKALAKSEGTFIREAAPMTSAQVESWLEGEAKKIGLKLSRHHLSLIQESSENRLGEMLDSLNKLVLYIAPRVEPTSDDINELLPEARVQTTVWTLLDKLALRQTSDVISLTRILIESGQEVLGIIALVHRRLRELLAARSVLQLGGGEANLAQTLQMNG